MRTDFVTPCFPTFLHYSETSQNFVTFAKIYMAIFIQKKNSISEPLRVQRSAAGIFKKLKALDMSLIIYHRKVFTSQIIKKDTGSSHCFI